MSHSCTVTNRYKTRYLMSFVASRCKFWSWLETVSLTSSAKVRRVEASCVSRKRGKGAPVALTENYTRNFQKDDLEHLPAQQAHVSNSTFRLSKFTPRRLNSRCTESHGEGRSSSCLSSFKYGNHLKPPRWRAVRIWGHQHKMKAKL